MGRNIEQSIVIKADVQTTLSGMNEVVNKLNQGLREGATKVDLTKGIGLSLSKQIDKYKTELGKFSELTKGNKVEFADAGNAIKSGENLIKTFREIKRVVGDFDNLSVFDAKKLFPDAFDTKVSDLLSSLSNLEASLTRLNQKQISLQTARDEITSLKKDAEAFKGLMDQEATVKINLDEAKETLKAVEDEIDRLRQQASEGIELKIEAARKESGKAMLDQQQIWRELNKKGVNEADFSGSTVNATKFKGKSATAWEKQASKKDGSEASKAEAKAALEAIRIYNQEKAVLIELSRVINDRDNEIKELTTSLSKISKMSLPEAMRISSDSTDDIKIANDLLEAHKQAQEEVAEAEAKYALAQGHAKGAAKAYKETTTAIEVQQSKIEKLTTEIGELEREVGNVSLEKAFSAAGVKDFSVEMLKSKEGVNELKIKLQQLDEEKLTTLKKELKDMGLNTEIVEEALDGVRGVIKQVDDGADDIKKTAQEIENLKGQVLGFFSLTNSVELFKRAVRGAMETVKELDKTMTEAAVVTEFSVSDMWDKLPVYSDEAQKLGVSINSMYQATTLYYQQGLKTNEAMALGVETMKMAKIAAMDSTEATKAMTSALRGFNMELNETSATKVNDVYSQLAAVTAADTAQIATAMEKTASIAASANMEFETTAALLAQIIETTQEAPETAGTAMKTIIARFSEVKALKDQGETTGKDSEGEVIDVNKIQTALRTVGISMDNFFEGTEGLDSVLLRLAEKWDTLDFKTQRYIATTAAGSRQQSRFIAMMSDYARTTELVGEAQNSAGASQRQFQKTQDSMEAKIQRLENAWNQFLMGLANNEILKGAVDALTFIIENINSLTEALSGGHGLIKSIISLVTVISGLKIGKDVFGKVLGWAGSQFIGQGEAGNKLDLTGLVAPKESGQRAGKIYSEELVKAAANGIKSKRNKLSSFINKLFPNKEKTEKDSEKEQKTAIKPDTSEITETAEEMEKVGDKMNETAEDTNKLKASVESATPSIEDIGDAAQQAGQNVDGTGEKIKKAGEEAEKTNTKTQGLVKGMQAAGVAMVVAGSAASLLSSYLESLGMEEAAKSAAVISNILTGLGSLLATLPGMIGGIKAAAAALGVSSVAAFGAIAAAIAILVGLVIVFTKAFEAASDTAQLEKMREHLQDLTSATDEARKKIEEMGSAREKLEEMNKTFDNLVKGTNEWKRALIENNQQVLELINTYSQLAGYVATGKNGELIIEDAGWEKMLETQQLAYTSVLGAKTAMTQKVQEKELSIQTENIMSDKIGLGTKMDRAEFASSGWGKAGIIGGTYLAATLLNPILAIPAAILSTISAFNAPTVEEVEREQTGGLNYEQFNEFAALAAERGYSVSDQKMGIDETRELLGEMGIAESELSMSLTDFTQQVNKLGSDFDELANSARSVTLAEQARADSIAATIAQSSEKVQASEFGAVAEEIASQTFENYSVRVNEKTEEYLEKIDTGDLESGETAGIISRYAELQGVVSGEIRRQIENDEIAIETIAATLAAQDINEDFQKGMENTVSVFENISKNITKENITLLEGLATDRGLGLGLSVLEKLPDSSDNMEQYLEKMGASLKDMGFEVEHAKAMGIQGEDDAEIWENFVRMMAQNAIQAQEAYGKAFEKENTFGYEVLEKQIINLSNSFKDLGSKAGLTVEQTQTLANTLAKVAANGGNTEALLQHLPSMLQGLTDQNLENAIELLTTTDWTNQDSIDSTISALRELGVNIDEELAKKIYMTSQAIKKFNIEAVEKQLSNLQSLIDKVVEKAKDDSKVYSKEERDALVAAGIDKDQFVQIGVDDYSFMGETENLLTSLNNQVGDILGQMRADVDEAVERGQRYEAVFNDKETRYSATVNGQLQRLDGGQIIEKLVSGELKPHDEGDVILRSTLESLVEKTGVLEGDLKRFSDEMLSEALIQGYQNHYGYGGVIFDKNKETQRDFNTGLLTTEYAQVAGTQEFYNLWAKDVEKQKRLEEASGELLKMNVSSGDFGDLDRYVEIGGQTRYATNKDGITQQTAQFDPAKLLEAAATQEGFLSKYSLDPMVLMGMQDLGSKLGIQGAAEMDFATLQQELTAYYDSMYRGEQVLDALIESEAGLDVAVDQTTQQLADQGSGLSKNSVLIKQLVLANNQANKNMDNLNETLEEQSDAFKLGDKNSAQYRTALSKVTTAAKKVFGSDITEEFVHENRELFEQLAEGGETGQAAYEELGKRAAAAFLGMEHDSQEFANILNAAMAGVPTDLEIGASFDATEAINNLIALGYTAKEAAAIMEKMGFSVTYTTETHHIGDVTGTDYGVGAPGATIDNESTTGTSVVVAASATKNDSAGTGFSGGGGGGGGGGDKWENPYDKYHNTLEEINDLLRERERLERRYQRLVNQGTATAEKLSQISKDNIQTQRDEIAKQEYLIAGREAQIENQIKANPEMEKYVYVETDQFGDQTIRIDWAKINAISDTEEGEKVTQFYDKIDEWLESIYESQEAILEAEDAIWEELQHGKDEYLNLEEQVKDALIDQYQKEIDNLSAINDTINDTNTQLIESMQNSVDKYRQDRDNERTEQELSDKQRRLAYLQQDTSGANALEIMNLQKEIEQGQEDYTDTLVDQKISELQDQNEKAAEQRQRQIDIMQQQLDKYVESGEIWKQVEELISAGTSNTKNLITGSELETLLKNSGGFEGMSKIQQMDWLQSTNVLISQALKWLSDGAVSTFSTGKEVTFTTSDGKTVTGVANAQGEIEAKGQIYKDVAMDAYGNYSTKETIKDAKSEYNKREEEKRKAKEEANQQAKFPYGIVPSQIGRILYNGTSGTDVKALQDALNQLGYNSGDVDGNYGPATAQAVRRFQRAMGLPADGDFGPQTKEKMRLKGYKTGGLADFTGPAWLDGTTARPEYVLNADQTKAFFSLVDVLGSLRSGVSKTTQNSGDSNYDIDINVESIGSDYDVEQLATTVKRLINEDARYRNNNTINLMR